MLEKTVFIAGAFELSSDFSEPCDWIFMLEMDAGSFYSVFHKTLDKRFPKFVWISRSSLQTWQFHYVVVSQMVNFKTKLRISRQIS